MRAHVLRAWGDALAWETVVVPLARVAEPHARLRARTLIGRGAVVP